MKGIVSFALSSALALLIAAGMLFTSGAPPHPGEPAPSAVPQSPGRTLTVTSPADSGPGTLRQALLDAQPGDTITFDPAVFPPSAPVTITLTSGLPELTQGNLTIDASDAGVILDGSHIGTTPQTLLLDDVSLTLNDGPNLITNGDFSAGLGHWRPFDDAPGATRSLNSSDFHSSPQSFAWTTVIQAGEGHTAYDTTDTSEPFPDWPYQADTTVWMAATGGSTAELRFWYRYGGVSARLHALFPDGHVEQISDRWFDSVADWTEAVASQVLPADAVGIALELSHDHSELGVSGLSIVSNGNTIQGLQILHFPSAGIGLWGGAQNNTIGGDQGIGAGPLGQGNLLSGNGSFGVGLWGTDTSFNTIVGNYIGTDLGGTTAWGIRRDGVHINGASHNQVMNNLISGNGQSGVYICCTGEENITRDNYIGTDASGLSAVGNLQGGVTIDQGARDNVIGPENVIAHNGVHGVEIRTSDAVGNTITRNSIHDNGGMGIELWDGGNTELAAPLIFDFDLTAGTVAGTTCANCVVEIFSDSSDEGKVYEGWTTADGLGSFTFSKGASFTGPHLTATATDTDGNTSEFSSPTSDTRRSLVLQVGNSLPRTEFQTRRSRELEDNRIGDMLSLRAGIPTDFVAKHDQLGMKWLRLSLDYLDWSAVEATGEYSQFYVDPVHDQVITGLADQGVTILYCLVFWDDQIEPIERGYARFKTEEEIQRYLDYARFIVRHFKGRIQYYEILNETFFEEDSDFTQQNVELADYINLVRRVMPIIREEDPQARIVAGPAPSVYQQETYDYQIGILESDVIPLVDAVSWHPGSYPQEYSDVITYLYQVPETVQEIRETAAAHGFTGEYIVEELKWPTAYNPSPTEPWFMYSETVAAKYYARGIVDHLGMGVVALLGHTAYDGHFPKMDVIRNLSTLMAGAEPVALPIDIQSQATNIKTYTFSLSNGDHLFALWTDGVAVDDDPGVPATLTFNGFADQRVTGIDVLHGFEQQLITSQEDGNLVVRDLLVRDYPLILRLGRCYDLTGDRQVSVADIAAIAQVWRTEEGEPGFNPDWDFDSSGRIDVVDIMHLAANWGQTCG